MIRDRQLPPFQAKQVNQSGQRYFIDDRGIRLPSVSSILNATKPQADREALLRWRDRVGAAAASQISSTASRRGTGTHQHLKRYLLGQPTQPSEAVQPYWESLEPVLQEVQDVRLVEGFVFHDELRYAGRVDCIASYQGIPCVLDWKTADKPRGTIDRLHDAPLQLAAYCGATNACYADHQVDLRHAAVIVAVPGQVAEVFWLEPSHMAQYWQAWQARLDQYHSRRSRL